MQKMEQKDHERETIEARVSDMVRVLAQCTDGRFFLKWLLELSGFFQVRYPENHAVATWQEGKRFIGSEIVRLAQHAGVAGKILEDGDGERNPGK